MAIAFVKAGAISTAATTTVSPSFGQATTATNLLIACVAATNNANLGNSISTSASGWLRASDGARAAVWYKPNCSAGETAPTFTETVSGSTTSMWAVLAEFSGVATASAVDQTGSGESLTTPFSMACSATDTTSSDVAVACCLIGVTKSATDTITNTWTPSGGTSGSLGNTGSTKALFAFNAAYYLLNAHGGGAADTDQVGNTLSTGAFADGTWSMASFKPPVSGTTYTKAGHAVESA